MEQLNASIFKIKQDIEKFRRVGDTSKIQAAVIKMRALVNKRQDILNTTRED